MKNKIVIAGGAGFLGRSLARYFSEKGYRVTILSRGREGQEGSISFVKWDGANLGPWQQELEGAEALINLSGRSVDCRYTEQNKKDIIASRVNSTRAIGNAIRQCAVPPMVWMNASSATIYRHAEDRAMDEQQGEIGEGFSVDVCREWEKELNSFETTRTRKVALRIAMVLSKEDGVMKPMMNLVRFGMGGPLSGGKQYISWIHMTDFVRMIEWILRHDELSGPLNICAPNPLPNREFMKQLRKAMGVPFGMPQPSWVMRVGAIILQTETELIEKSRRVVPGTIMKSGFEFSFPNVEHALKEIVR